MTEDEYTFDGWTKDDIEAYDKVIKSIEPDNYDWMMILR